MNINKIIRTAKAANDKIVTPVIDQYLLRHGDDPFPAWVNEQLFAIMATKPRIRSGSFSGSAAGHCLRAQELAYAGVRGEPVDPQLQNIFNDGKYRHLRWQGMLLTTGLVTHVEYLVRWPQHFSRGSLDGRGVVRDDHPRAAWRGKEYGVEVKGVSPYQFQALKANGPGLKHHKQIHHYFVLSNVDMFVYIAEDKATQAYEEFVIFPDPQLLQEAEDDICLLSDAVKNRTLHAVKPLCRQRKGPEYQNCAFGRNGRCLEADTHLPAPFVRTL